MASTVYIDIRTTDPAFNLALEQYVFDYLPKKDAYFMLWRNDNAIIIGKHQNTMAEINPAYVKEHDIRVVRRLSGGGAVYHDLGNLNFTFIVDNREDEPFDFASFCEPVVKALGKLGVAAEITGRNDMTIAGKKFSGNSQYSKNGRTMHHGTIMYDSNLDVVGEALNVSRDKLEAKGVKSVRSRVTNVKPYVKDNISMERFMELLKSFMFEAYGLKEYGLTEKDFSHIEELKHQVYDTWNWNYGTSHLCQIVKHRRIEGCGQFEIHMDLDKGRIKQLHFFGDYFSVQDPEELQDLLLGSEFQREAICERLKGVALRNYFKNITLEQFLDVLLY